MKVKVTATIQLEVTFNAHVGEDASLAKASEMARDKASDLIDRALKAAREERRNEQQDFTTDVVRAIDSFRVESVEVKP